MKLARFTNTATFDYLLIAAIIAAAILVGIIATIGGVI